MTETADVVVGVGKPPTTGGLYGLRLPDIGPENGHLLPKAPPTWPEWRVGYDDLPSDPPPLTWSSDLAVLPLQPRGLAVVDRVAARTNLLGVPSDDAALLHPYFGTSALAFATWSGRLALHGGVLDGPSGSWGLLGEREAGKSSVLAWWIRNGDTVLADDLVITDGGTVFTGPRFVDLRESAHDHFGLGVDVGVLGTRRRWRVPLPQAPAETPFAGLIELAWGSEIAVDVVPMSRRLMVVATHRGLQLPIDVAERSLLQVLGKPMLRFTRPKSWSEFDTAMRQLQAALEGL